MAHRCSSQAKQTSGTSQAEALAVRIDRQRILQEPQRTFEFILTEAALRWRAGPDLIGAQLEHVASVNKAPNVSIGVIPVDAQMHAMIRCAFIIYENGSTINKPLHLPNYHMP